MYHAVHRGQSEGRLLILGDGPLDQVELVSCGRRFELSPERQRLADQACQRMRDGGMTVTINPVYRLTRWSLGERLTLHCDLADYSQVVGTKSHPEWGVKAQVLAVCCVTECRDGFVIEKRSARVAALPGRWHIAPSGSLEPPNGPLATLLEEAHEELGLQASEVLEPRCLGLLYGETSGVYQLTCSARVEASLEQIVSRQRSGQWEADGYLCAPACPEGLPAFLRQYEELLTVGGRIALWAEGRRRWGESWFENHAEDKP